MGLECGEVGLGWMDIWCDMGWMGSAVVIYCGVVCTVPVL